MSPALRVALSMALMRAPCSEAAFSRRPRYTWVARLRGRTWATTLAGGGPGVGLGRQIGGDQLQGGRLLRDHRLELGEIERRHVELAGIEQGQHLLRDRAGDGEGDLL